ncbi:hypothetical protein [Acinetobacter ursingii]|uniref:hypothetical protein n=1 Tax=Acinetobacter ursingii TaxID=108980 RepID=UPI00300A09D7
MEKSAWIAVIVGAVLGALTLLGGLFGANSAVQEGSAFSLAIAFPMVPYCLARALNEIAKIKRGEI